MAGCHFLVMEKVLRIYYYRYVCTEYEQALYDTPAQGRLLGAERKQEVPTMTWGGGSYRSPLRISPMQLCSRRGPDGKYYRYTVLRSHILVSRILMNSLRINSLSALHHVSLLRYDWLKKVISSCICIQDTKQLINRARIRLVAIRSSPP